MRRAFIPNTLGTGEARGRLMAAGFKLDHKFQAYIQPVRGTMITSVPQPDGRLYEQRDYWE